REWRRVTLAVVERAGDDRHRPVRLEANAAHLLRWRRGDFEVAADAEPAYLAALAAFPLAPSKAAQVRNFERMLEHAGKIAAVIRVAGGRLARNIARANHVAAAQFQAIDLELRGGHVDHPLHVVIAFRPARPAVSRYMARVGEHAFGGNLD